MNRQLILELLVGLILAKAPPPTDGSMAFEKYPLVFTGQAARLELDFLLKQLTRISMQFLILSIFFNVMFYWESCLIDGHGVNFKPYLF